MQIEIVKNVLAENENLAAEVRKRLRRKRQSLVNFMSAPGSGKTLLLEKLIPCLGALGLRVGVIEGDITTTNDAARIQPLGVPVAQINTEPFGGDCHLAANVILGALDLLEPHPLDAVLIENVGNLVCPAEFDTGADLNVVLWSVTEGEDKPLKYPLMFRTCRLLVVTKLDLLQPAGADLELMKANVRRIHPDIEIAVTSARTGEGLDALAARLADHHKKTVF
jgi:hydrogenase nickel incorporation protein HypB